MKLAFIAIAFPVLAVCLCTAVQAAESYYADVGLDVSPDGSVAISGLSNHPGLSSGAYQEYTSKEGSYWILNVTLPGEFSEYVYTVRMPQGSVINYVRSSGRIEISHDGSISINGVGSGSLAITVQYHIEPSTPAAPGTWPLIAVPAAIGTVLIISGAFLAVRGMMRRKKLSSGSVHAVGNAACNYNPSLLSGRQLDIVRALEKNAKPMTQHQLEVALSLPKSSVSRNISSLVRAGILVRHSRGMSNAVWFAEKKSEKSEKP